MAVHKVQLKVEYIVLIARCSLNHGNVLNTRIYAAFISKVRLTVRAFENAL